MAPQDSCSSSARSSLSDGDSADKTTMEDCQGTQPYLFEPYDSEASSDADSTSESEGDQQFERLQTKTGEGSIYVFLSRVSFRTFVTRLH